MGNGEIKLAETVQQGKSRMTDNRKNLRIGIIGCGVIAYDHLGALLDRKASYTFLFCDTRRSAAEKLGASFNQKYTYVDDAQKLFTEHRPDVVHVLTPPDSHYFLTKQALEEGIHVLVEKPMAFTLAETRELIDLAARNEKKVCVDHSLLYMPCVRTAFDWLEQGRCGKIISVHAFFGHAEKKKCIPYGGVSHWAYKMPGGPMLNILSHPASILVALLGEPDVIQFMAEQRHFMPDHLPDMVTFSMKTPRGLGTCTLSMAHGDSSRYLVIETEKSSIYVDLARQLSVNRAHAGRLGFLSKALTGMGMGTAMTMGTIGMVAKVATKKIKRNPGTREMVVRFYDALCQDKDLPVSTENMIGVARIIEEVLINNGVQAN